MKNLLLLILMLYRLTLYSQPDSGDIQTIDNLLKLTWTHDISEWSPYDGYPLLYEGILFPYQNTGYALKAETGEQVPYASQKIQEVVQRNADSLLSFANFHKNKQKIEHTVINITNDKTLINESTDRLIYLGYSTPTVIENNVIYFPKNRNQLVALDIKTSEVIWQYTTINPICTEPKVKGKYLYFSDEQVIYALDKDSGKEKWHQVLGKIVSSLEIKNNYLYVWAKPTGLIALNLDTQHTEWTFNAVPAHNDNYNLIVDGDTLFLSSKSILAVDRKNGSLLWQSEYEDSKSGIHITAIDDHILYYDIETDSDVPPLTALNKHTGKVEYQYFTSETYPQDFENERALNRLDYATMKFVRGVYHNMIFGVYHDKIYAFEILKK